MLPPISICFFSPSSSATSGTVTIWVTTAEGLERVWMQPPSALDLPPVAASMSAALRTPQVSRPVAFFLVVIFTSPCFGAVVAEGLVGEELAGGFFEVEVGSAGSAAAWGSAIAEPLTCSAQPVAAVRVRLSAMRMAAGRRCIRL